MIQIINLSDTELGDAVYVGRPMPRKRMRGSPLANRHKIDAKNGITRDMCIGRFLGDLTDARMACWEFSRGERRRRPTLYQERLSAEIDHLTLLYLETGHLTLACWCHPQSCHANVIASVIERTASNIRALLSGVPA